MKFINKLDDTNDKSPYSGKANVNYEMFIKPAPEVNKEGVQLTKREKYYIFRLLNFQTDERQYPFIVRNEHEYYKKDASGKIIDVKRICCPSTPWAKQQLNETVAKGYCPICKLSFEQNKEAWKSFKTSREIDSVCLQISKDTQSKWAVYIPVLVIKDPNYERNNNHLRILRLSGDEGKSTFNRILSVIHEANDANINVFNGEEGANIAILCEKQTKLYVKKDGSPSIDPKTGEQRSHQVNCVTDVRLLSKNLYSYSNITEEAIEKLGFDETYGTAATKAQLNVFMNENYLNTGASDSDFGEDFDEENDFSEPAVQPKKEVAVAKTPVKKNVTNIVAEETAETDDFEEDDVESEEESVEASEITKDDLIEDEITDNPASAIERITKGRVKIAKSVELPHDTQKLREETTSFDDDDLPF